MQLIIVDGSFSRSRTLSVPGWCLAALAAVLAVLVVFASVWVYRAFSVPSDGPVSAPESGSVLAAAGVEGTAKHDLFVRQNIDAMARKVGEMQARMVQLESLSERVSTMAGVAIPASADKKSGKPPGQGGVLVGGRPLSMQELQSTLESLDRLSGQRTDLFTVMESRLLDQHLSKHMIPTQQPVLGQVVGSGFGWRIDPITGNSALHTGLDFPAATGSDILAAAGGVVVTQEFHPAYGNMLEIDHGNQVLTRYAHASRVLVRRGDVVRRGQKIAQVGTTGRSTGPHLHFEVWVQGVLQNPQKFLENGDATTRALAAATTTDPMARAAAPVAHR